MSDFVRCKTCGEWGWIGAKYNANHVCPPIWEARIHETKYENGWTEVYARDAEEAASKFCKDYDGDGDYSIIQSGEAEVDVRRLGDDQVTLVDISAESVPTYYARARRHEPENPELKTADRKQGE